MDEVTTIPALPEKNENPSISTTPQPLRKVYPKVELSPETRAFIHRMAENLRTHNPDVPKGRNRQY